MATATSPITSSTVPTTSSTSSTNSSSSSTNGTAGLGNETTFLQLLVSEIQNQDPTQPMDSSTFLTQLAEFSQLEQLVGINQGVATLDSAATPATTTGTADTSNGNTSNSSNPTTSAS